MSGKLKVLDLFSGIGGFSLGLERTGGFETVAFCEIEPFCRRVLAKHWPNVRQYEDVRELTADTLRRDGIAVDVITGGFPCQDISVAGKGAGLEGERSGLWFEFARLIRDLRPLYVLVENVSALLGRGLGRVLGDLAALGFNAEWHCIPASAVGAPHRRDRVWLVANSQSEFGYGRAIQQYLGERAVEQSSGGGRSPLPDAKRRLGEAQHEIRLLGKQNSQAAPERLADAYLSADRQWRAEPNVGRVADGVPQRVDRLKSLGNAVVPQIPELIGNAILESRRAAA